MAHIDRELQGAGFSPQQILALTRLFDTVRVDIAAQRTAITGITAQLDADAGVTDTDYAANNDPAALTLTT